MIKAKQSKRERQTFFGCVAPHTGEVVAKRADRGNAKSFKRFLLKVLRRFRGRKVIMFLDNVKYHHAKCLQPFLLKNAHRIELIFLPPYSPDFNPMERIWWFMRKKITHNRFVETLDERVKSFWQLFSSYSYPNSFIQQLCNISYSV